MRIWNLQDLLEVESTFPVNYSQSCSPSSHLPNGRWEHWRALFFMAEQHVVLFVDAQNLYRGARRAFFRHGDSHTYGQVNPVALGQLICSRPPPGYTRVFTQVRVYTGRPDASKQPRTYAAHRKQCAAWEAFGARVIFRPLRYPLNWPI